MANPFLVLGGIAISVVTAAFGVLAVPGWISSAQDTAAIHDLSGIRNAQEAVVSATGVYSGNLAALSADGHGVKLSLSGGVLPVDVTGNEDGWCAVLEAETGTFHAASSTKAGSATGADALAAATAAGCSSKLLPLTGAQWTISCPVAVSDFYLPINQATGEAKWSDGQTKTYLRGAELPTRALAANVEYKVTFNGTFSDMTTSFLSAASRNCIRSLDAWAGNTQTANMNQAFYSLANLTSVPAEIPPGVTTMISAFAFATSFNSPIEYWDVSKVTDMQSMFANAFAFNQPIGRWDTSNVTTLLGMFSNARAFNQPIGNWNTSKVTTLDSTFTGASSFNQPLDWDTSKVTSLAKTFQYASEFNGDISGWDTGNVTTLEATFGMAGKFNKPLNDWRTSKVTSMSGTFSGASVFNQQLSKWDLSKVAATRAMFDGAQAFSQPIGNWVTSAVTNMSYMFKGATNMHTQDLSGWDTSNVTDMSWMFEGSYWIPNMSTWNVAKVTSYGNFGGLSFPQNRPHFT